MPVKVRKLDHVLEPGMLVRPRRPDGSQMDANRWIVVKLSPDGYMTQAESGHGKLHYSCQWFATDTLIPCKRKGSGKVMMASDRKPIRRKKPDPNAPPPVTLVKKQIGVIAPVGVPAPINKPEKAKKPVAPVPQAVVDMQQLLLTRHTLEGWLDIARGYGVSTVSEWEHAYDTLGPGLQRMNIGNRLRSFIVKNPGARYIDPAIKKQGKLAEKAGAPSGTPTTRKHPPHAR